MHMAIELNKESKRRVFLFRARKNVTGSHHIMTFYYQETQEGSRNGSQHYYYILYITAKVNC